MSAFIFDLDGVLVDTAHFHYLAWKKIGEELDITFSLQDNERLKGIDRRNSLKLLLEIGGKSLEEDKFNQLLIKKNDHYLELVDNINEKDLFEGVLPLLESLKNKDIKIALGSASKNAKLILKKLGIIDYFDYIVDGNMTTNGKPDPQVFLLSADKFKIAVERCVVIEDSKAGIDAAITANMHSVGIGEDPSIQHADINYSSMKDFSLEEALSLLP